MKQPLFLVFRVPQCPSCYGDTLDCGDGDWECPNCNLYWATTWGTAVDRYSGEPV